MNLSKSKYCKGIQCPKILWMDRNMPEQFDQSVMNETILQTGNDVGDLAMGYFGEYTEIPYSRDIPFMLSETQRLLKAGTDVITEATFAFAENLCMVDILRTVQDGYELIEVKSSTCSPSDGADKVKAIYLDDMAYQTYVLTNCGVNIQRVFIMQLNKGYVRHGDLDIHELFSLIDCTERVFGMQRGIADTIARIKAVAGGADEPESHIGRRCGSPYECGYKGWCFRHLPPNNVFEIGWRMWSSAKEDAYYAGMVTFDDVLKGRVALEDQQRRQILTVTENLPPQIDKAAIRRFISEIRYPLYHLDFETFQQAIPQWDFVAPYTQIPFQYSLHIQNKPCGEAEHREFLGKEGLDPRRELAERLCADIPMNACVMAYYMTFEKGRIKELSSLFPDLAEHLMSLHDHMLDLASPFQSGAYYCREMGGSYSIKTVLPALCPGDPELDYRALKDIHNGSEAMDAYQTLHTKSPAVIRETREALLAYCRLDTLAMVKILEKLYAAAGERGKH